MFGLGKKHPHVAHVKALKKAHKHGLFHGDIDDLTSGVVEDLEPPTSLNEEIETLDSDDAVGEMGTPGEDYGRGDAGRSVDNNLRPGPGGGGLDPFRLATFGDDPADAIPYDGSMDPSWSLDDYTDDLAQAYQPVGPDDFDFPEQVATLRHPIVDFGGEFYPFAGPAAVLGGEMKK